MPNVEEYSWQYLVRQPYGTAIWDIANIDNSDACFFLIRERRAEIERLPDNVDAHWKAGGVGMKVAGWRVMPVVILINFYPLQCMYEMWFNFYGEAQDTVQEAVSTLGKQPRLYILFFDTGPDPVRGFGFKNEIQHIFRGMSGMMKALPPWDDNLFNLAKYQLQSERSLRQLWDYLE